MKAADLSYVGEEKIVESSGLLTNTRSLNDGEY